MPAHDRARPVRTDARNKLTSPEYRPVLVTGILLVLMFVIGGVRYAGFVSPETVLNLLVDNAYLIVLAVGMTFVILSGGIDRSVGAVVALSTMIAASLLQAGSVLGVLVLGTIQTMITFRGDAELLVDADLHRAAEGADCRARTGPGGRT